MWATRRRPRNQSEEIMETTDRLLARPVISDPGVKFTLPGLMNHDDDNLLNLITLVMIVREGKFNWCWFIHNLL